MRAASYGNDCDSFDDDTVCSLYGVKVYGIGGLLARTLPWC
jgi:hypothetical protein